MSGKASHCFYATNTNGFSSVCKSPAAYYARMQMPLICNCNYRTICRAHRDNKDTRGRGDHLEIAFPPRGRHPNCGGRVIVLHRKLQLNAGEPLSHAPLLTPKAYQLKHRIFIRNIKVKKKNIYLYLK